MEDKLSGPVKQVSDTINALVDGVITTTQANHITEPINNDVLAEKAQGLTDSVNNLPFEYATVDTTSDELQQKFTETVVSLAFQKLVEQALAEYIQQRPSGNSSLEGTSNEQIFFNKIATILDLLIYLVSKELLSVKPVFYESVLTVLTVLAEMSTYQVEHFWGYMESRQKQITDHVFKNKVILDRISFLDICNRLTDRYNIPGKKDTYSKDSYNDQLQFRVRLFLANIFLFEDNTGLNKYFNVSEKKPVEFKKILSPFLEDIIYIQRVFNDPYLYLSRSHSGELKSLTSAIKSVYGYLLREEKSYRKSKDATMNTIKKDESIYYPETYLLSGFEKNAEMSKEDSKFFNALFNHSEVRMQYLIMIYFLSNLYVEMGTQERRDFLSSIAPTAVKHVTDRVLGEGHKQFFVSAKQEIEQKLSEIDPMISNLLQQMVLTEKKWWAWLIYGKDPKTNQPLFADKTISEEELSRTQETFESLFPFKSKKYFNTYVTPQLTRKMRVETGLDKVERNNEERDFNVHVELLNERIEREDFDEEVVDQRNSWLWKKVRQQRDRAWLEIGELVSPEELSVKEEEKVKEEENVEEKEENVEENEKNVEEKEENVEEKEVEMKDVEGNVENGNGDDVKKDEDDVKKNEDDMKKVDYDGTDVKLEDNEKLGNSEAQVNLEVEKSVNLGIPEVAPAENLTESLLPDELDPQPTRKRALSEADDLDAKKVKV